jgi:hypothetical protein
VAVGDPIPAAGSSQAVAAEDQAAAAGNPAVVPTAAGYHGPIDPAAAADSCAHPHLTATQFHTPQVHAMLALEGTGQHWYQPKGRIAAQSAAIGGTSLQKGSENGADVAMNYVSAICTNPVEAVGAMTPSAPASPEPPLTNTATMMPTITNTTAIASNAHFNPLLSPLAFGFGSCPGRKVEPRRQLLRVDGLDVLIPRILWCRHRHATT